MASAVDVHTHFVPRTMPSGIGRTPLWPSVAHDGDRSAVMVDGKVFRVIDSRSWDADRRLHDMAKDDVAVQVVSPMPELLSHWFPADDADAFAQHVNSEIAALCAKHPRGFIGIGMVPLQDVALAARRLADIKSLGLCGVEIGTHIDGVALGDARLNEFYAAAEEADLSIMTHPLHPAGMERIAGPPQLAAVAAFPLETAFAATSILTHGVLDRFPRLRIMLSHGGGALPWILPRMHHAMSLGPPFTTLFAQDPIQTARRFFYDTVLYDPRSLTFLADMVGMDNIVVGSDYPFTIMQERPALFAESALGRPRAAFADAAARFLNRPALADGNAD